MTTRFLQKNKTTGQYFLNLPKAIMEHLDWDHGQPISIKAGEKHSLILKKA